MKEKETASSVIGRKDVIVTIRNALNNNNVLCIYGPTGVGKSYIVNAILRDYKYVELDQKLLKNGITTQDFLKRSKFSTHHILIEDGLTDLPGWKEIAEHVRTGNSITRGGTIIISQNINKIDFCDCLYVDKPPLRDFISIGNTRFPHITKERLITCAQKADGDIRTFLSYLDFSSEKDRFFTPKDFVHKLLSGEIDSAKYIGEVIEDHGYSSGIVHENYVNGEGSYETYCKVSDAISYGDTVDNKLYEGHWCLTPYFCTHSIVEPCSYVKGTVDPDECRPGSCWTKYNNYKMRSGKLQSIKTRTGMGMEELLLLRDYCIHDYDKAIQLMKEYKFEPGDVDTLNHVALVTKLKSKVVQKLKTSLKNAAKT